MMTAPTTTLSGPKPLSCKSPLFRGFLCIAGRSFLINIALVPLASSVFSEDNRTRLIKS